jgi:hypothetical protein
VEGVLEEAIDAAYRECFRVRTVAGQPLTLRIPFGMSGERQGPGGFRQRIYMDGKGSAQALWDRIDSLILSAPFTSYAGKLAGPGEKAVAFDLQRGAFSVYTDPRLLSLVKEGPYPGTRTKIWVLKPEAALDAADVYDYLYCVGGVGLDCSGFVYHVQRSAARALGVQLDRELGSILGVDPGEVAGVVGLWLFDPANGFVQPVPDHLAALRPGDVFLFRGREPDGRIGFRHSAVIQSIDRQNGLLRYLQCTDWAPRPERGVHESWIRFDPHRADLRLGDPSLEWTQEVCPTFEGETALRYWRNDGHRYRSYMEQGGTVMVRLKSLAAAVTRLEAGFYAYSSESPE